MIDIFGNTLQDYDLAIYADGDYLLLCCLRKIQKKNPHTKLKTDKIAIARFFSSRRPYDLKDTKPLHRLRYLDTIDVVKVTDPIIINSPAADILRQKLRDIKC